jgi:DnaJ-class molecular chaperone
MSGCEYQKKKFSVPLNLSEQGKKNYDNIFRNNCQQCGGTGKIPITQIAILSMLRPYYQKCYKCDGTGKILKEEE